MEDSIEKDIQDAIKEAKESTTEIEPIESAVEEVVIEATEEETQEAIEEPILEASNEEEIVEVEASEANEAEAKEWTPDYTYKSTGKSFDLPEWAKTQMNEGNEREIKEWFEKAQGLEFFKEKHTKLEEEHAQKSEEYDALYDKASQYHTVVENFNNSINSESVGDWHQALKTAGVDEKKILKVAKHILDYKELSPEQRAFYDNQYTQKNKISEYEAKLSEQEQALQRTQQESHMSVLRNAVNTKKDLVHEYESAEGKNIGSFMQDFIKYGTIEQSMNPDITVEEALEGFIKHKGLGAKPKQIKKQVTRPQTLPNLGGSGKVPIQVAPVKSVEDIEKMLESYSYN